MILGIYIFIDRGRKFIFRKELEKFDDDTIDLINKSILKIVNEFENYEQGIYRTEVGSIKILFAVYGEIISIVLIKEEKIPNEEVEMTPELMNASDSLFASIIFNQPLLIKLIEDAAGIENFKFYSQKLPEEKQKILKKSEFKPLKELKQTSLNYFNNLDNIINEVNTKLSVELQEREIKTEEKLLPIQKVFLNFIELTFRYVRMYIMENLIRDLIYDQSMGSITDIQMGINDILFYLNKSLQVLKERPEIKYFFKIMNGQKFGIEIIKRTAFTISFTNDTISIQNGVDKRYPIIRFNSIETVINLILGKIDALKLALSNEVKASQLHKFVEWAAPLAAVLIRLSERIEIDNTTTIKRLTLEGLAHLIKALFIVNLKNNPQKQNMIRNIKKIISIQFIGHGVITIIIDGTQKDINDKIHVRVGPYFQEPDIIMQGSLEHICLYVNGEINFISAIQKIRLLKGISMNPIDIVKGKTFKQIKDLFSLWRLSQI
ncbi:MAG: hypothetical protein ACTSRP_04720 [Candidatus Helarchaeota archaeon]